jgi:4-hydroxybenzoate polyprenyltransferase
LLLARVSNLPTVWSNVVAGSLSAGVASGLGPGAPRVVVAASLFYTGGMLLNDAFDAAFDREARPERPIPNGDVPRGEVFAAGAALLAGGLALLSGSRPAVLLGLILIGAIVFYDARHKRQRFAPLVMGACRGLVYLIAATAAGSITDSSLAGAAVMTLYVVGLTVVAKRSGADARWLVPLLIAGISLVDGLFVLLVAPAHWLWAGLAALGFPLTLILQRWVPGD